MKRGIFRLGSRWPEVFLYAAIGLGPLSLACSSSAQTASARFAIESAQVVEAMREGLLPTDGVQIQLAAPVTASTMGARIEVESVSPVRPHQLRLRLACSDRSECLPFFATAAYPDAVDVSTLHLGRKRRFAADWQVASKGPVAVGNSMQYVKKAATKDAGMLRAGSTAMLEFEADRIHVRIEVISLQNGAPGSRVRVSSVDHKQIYVAEVITPSLLKGELSK